MGGDDGLVPIWHNDIFNHHNEAGWLLHVVSVHIYWLMFVYWNCNAFYLTLAKLSVSKNRLSFATVTINNVTSFKLIWKSPMYMSWFGNFFCFIFCEGNRPVIGGLFLQRASNKCFDVLFDVTLNKILNKQLGCLWFETTSCNVTVILSDVYKNYATDHVRQILLQRYRVCDRM